MDYDQSGEQMAAHVEHLHPALQDSDEPGAKRQRLNGEAPATEGVEQQPADLQTQEMTEEMEPHVDVQGYEPDADGGHYDEQYDSHAAQQTYGQQPPVDVQHYDPAQLQEQAALAGQQPGQQDPISALLAAGAAVDDPHAAGIDGHADDRFKKCQQCQREKPAADFNKEERNPDQLSNKCKGCRKAGQKQHLQPTVSQKQCKKCNIIKHASEFCKSKWGIDGLHSRCKECIKEALPMTEVPTVEKKQCSKCHEEKAAAEFDRYKRTADGLQSQCKQCMKSARTMVLEPTVVQKRCTKCRIDKPASEFFRFKFSSDGLQSYCKACKNASRQKQAQMAAEAKQAEVLGGPPPQQLQMQLPAVQQLQAQMPLDPTTHTPLYAANLMAPHDPTAAVSQGLATAAPPGQWGPAAAEAMQPPQQNAGDPAAEVGPQEPTIKVCPQCQETRSTAQFRLVPGSPDGLAVMCQPCEQEARDQLAQANAASAPPQEKQCSKCHMVQPATEFYRNKHTSDKLESQCKQCKRSALQNVTTPTVESKKCSKCEQVRAASCFDRYKRTSDGLQSQCKDCMKAARPVVKQPTVIEKPCSKCHVLKPANEFFRREQSHDGLQSWCRSCKNAARQAQDSRPSNSGAPQLPPTQLPPAQVPLQDMSAIAAQFAREQEQQQQQLSLEYAAQQMPDPGEVQMPFQPAAEEAEQQAIPQDHMQQPEQNVAAA